MEQKRLKNCPFCGKRMKVVMNREYKRLEIKHNEYTDNCPVYRTWLYDTEDAAIEAWNQRSYKNQ